MTWPLSTNVAPGQADHADLHNEEREALNEFYAFARTLGIPDDAQETFPRPFATSPSTLASGTLRLAYFNARASRLVTRIITGTGSTAAGATPTLCRLGLYSVNSDGDLALVASTANDTTLWTNTSTLVSKNLSASHTLTKNSWYAVGFLIVTSATAPLIAAAPSPTPGTLNFGVTPRLSAALTGQTDLPTSIANGSLVETAVRHYARLAA